MKQKISIGILIFQLSALLFYFQNCSPSFKSVSETSESSLGPLSALEITVNGSSQFFAETDKISILVIEGEDSEIDPTQSSITAISGSCLANQSWAPLNQPHSPWTTGGGSGGANFLSGANSWNYSAQIDSQMGGCDWRGCVTSVNGSKACVEFQTRCQPGTPHPFSPSCSISTGRGISTCNSTGNGYSCVIPTTTCDPTTKPTLPYTETGLVCSTILNGYTGTYSRTAPYVCNVSSLTWVPGTNFTNNTSTCVAPSANCNPADKKPDKSEFLTCASNSSYGPTYSGTYEIKTVQVCQGTTWIDNVTNYASRDCINRQCPSPTPPTVTNLSCSDRNPMFTGTYDQIAQCNNSNYTWGWTDNFADKCTSPYTKLSTLVGASPSGNVTISGGTPVFIDTNTDINVLTISAGASLICGGPGSYELKAKTIEVFGTFSCGTESTPYEGNLTISLKHNESTKPLTGIELAGAPEAAGAINYRALLINSGGKLILHGKHPGTHIARLAANVSGGNTITIDRSVPYWKAGDEIVIATTDFDSQGAETFKITAINGTQLTLSGNVQHLHYGNGVDDYSGQVIYGPKYLDQRAEVVNLTRTIKIQADDPNNQLKFYEQEANLGGHVMVMGSGNAKIDAVEFYKMGQAGIMARYPFHWHYVGANGSGQYIKNSTIHTSFQRCITIHRTNQTLVENNACYQYKGHGYFLEDGVEIQNTIQGNIALGSYFPFYPKVLLSSDDLRKGVGKRFPATAAFWTSNPNNKVKNNIAAGYLGSGFWNSFENNIGGITPVSTNTDEYSGNISHSGAVGQTWDGAPNGANANNPNNPGDRELDAAHYWPPQIPVFSNLVSYKNSQAGIYFRGNTAVYDNALLADNEWSFFMAYSQIVRNSTIINDSKFPSSFTHSSPDAQIGGITMYDGPFELEKVDFVNFPVQTSTNSNGVDVTPAPIFGIGGAAKFTNITSQLRFSPNPVYKAKLRKFVDNWAEEHLSNSIRDLDGSLSGSANSLILGGENFSHPAGCSINSQISGFAVCPSPTQVGNFRIMGPNSLGGLEFLKIPQLWHRSDGTVSLNESEISKMLTAGTDLYTKTNLVSSGNYSYETVMLKRFPANTAFTVDYTSENSTYTLSPVIKLTNLGSDCHMYGASKLSSLTELQASGSSSYFSDGSNFYVRLNADQEVGSLLALGQVNSSKSRTKIAYYGMSCSGEAKREITGVIDDVDQTTGRVSGWACNFGYSDQISIHVYAGGSAGAPGAQFVAAFDANLPSEPGVAQACGDGNLKGHRFSFVLPAGLATTFSGQSVYVHGISVNGTPNYTIYRSGDFRFP